MLTNDHLSSRYKSNLGSPENPAEMATTLSHQQQLQQHIMRNARRQALQRTAASHGQQQKRLIFSAQNTGGKSNNSPSQLSRQTLQPQSTAMGSPYDDIPIDPDDYDAMVQEEAYVYTFASACQHGALSTVQTIVSSTPRTRLFLHHGLAIALHAGSIDIVRYLLYVGAPILRQTPKNILSAPSDQQISLFELLLQFGWTVNTPGFYGAVLLPRVVTNLRLLQWFLIHGADPNLGEQRDSRNRTGEPDTDSCAALEAAAGQGNVEAVRLLLDAGAKIQHGNPIHFAAGACPPGTNPHAGRAMPSKEFDQSRIPAMALLVERGADINQATESRHMVAKYAIVHAVMAGAVERVRWLLKHGADAELKGAYGSAVEYAEIMGSEEMRGVICERVRT